MILWHKFWYKFWRAIGSSAFFVYHQSQTMAHKSYISGGRWGRRNRKPLTAIYKFGKALAVWVRAKL